MDDNKWRWAKTGEEAKKQRKMFIRYGNISWTITLPMLLIWLPFGIFCLVGTLIFYASAGLNYIHDKLFLSNKETFS